MPRNAPRRPTPLLNASSYCVKNKAPHVRPQGGLPPPKGAGHPLQVAWGVWGVCVSELEGTRKALETIGKLLVSLCFLSSATLQNLQVHLRVPSSAFMLLISLSFLPFFRKILKSLEAI